MAPDAGSDPHLELLIVVIFLAVVGYQNDSNFVSAALTFRLATIAFYDRMNDRTRNDADQEWKVRQQDSQS